MDKRKHKLAKEERTGLMIMIFGRFPAGRALRSYARRP